MAEAAVYLATAPKSNSSYAAYLKAREDVESTHHLPVPLHLRNATTGLMKASGYGKGYKYAHDYEGHFVEQEHLPEELKGRKLFRTVRPGVRGRDREENEGSPPPTSPRRRLLAIGPGTPVIPEPRVWDPSTGRGRIR